MIFVNRIEAFEELMKLFSQAGISSADRENWMRNAIRTIARKKSRFDLLNRNADEYFEELERIQSDHLSSMYYDFYKDKLNVDNVVTHLEGTKLVRGSKTIEDDVRLHVRGKTRVNIEDEKLDFYSIMLGFDGCRDAHFYEFKSENKRLSHKSRYKVSGDIDINSVGFAELISGLGESLSRRVLELLELKIDPKNISESIKAKQISQGSSSDGPAENHLIKLYSEILVSRNISEGSITTQIEMFFDSVNENSSLHWWDRSILANVLSTSIISWWDISKLNVLVRLASLKHEPFVKNQALIGIALALVLSSKEEVVFEQTTSNISDISLGSDFNICLYSVLNYLIHINPNRNISSRRTFSRNAAYEYFEPIREELTYVVTPKLEFLTSTQRTQFFTLLRNSQALDYRIKDKVLFVLNTLADDKVEVLFRLLNKEAQDFQEFHDRMGKKFDVFLLELTYNSCIEDFVASINSHRDFEAVFRKIEAFPLWFNPNHLLKLYHSFPYHEYSTLIARNFSKINFLSNEYQKLPWLSIIIALNKRTDESDEMIHAYEVWLSYEGDNPVAIAGLAANYRINGEKQGSIEQCLKALRLYAKLSRKKPGNFKILDEITQCWYSIGSLSESDKALEAYKTSFVVAKKRLSLKKDVEGIMLLAKSWGTIAEIAGSRRKFRRVALFLTMALDYDESTTKVIKAMSVFWFKGMRFRKSRKWLLRNLGSDLDNEDLIFTFLYLGHCELCLGNFEKAMTFYVFSKQKCQSLEVLEQMFDSELSILNNHKKSRTKLREVKAGLFSDQTIAI